MSQKDINQLLKALQRGSSPKEELSSEERFETRSPLTLFINKYNLKSGKDKVEAEFIYEELYIKNYNGKISKSKFFKEFKKEFKSGRTKNFRYYLLDSSKLSKYKEYKLRQKIEKETENSKIEREAPLLKKK